MHPHLRFRDRAIPFGLVRILAGAPLTLGFVYAISVKVHHHWWRLDAADGVVLAVVAIALAVSAAVAVSFENPWLASTALLAGIEATATLSTVVMLYVRTCFFGGNESFDAGAEIQYDLSGRLALGFGVWLASAPVVIAATGFHRRAGYDASGRFLLTFGVWQVAFTAVALAFAPRGGIVPLARMIESGLSIDRNSLVAVGVIAAAVVFSFAGLVTTAWLSAYQVRWLHRVFDGKDPAYGVVMRDERTTEGLPALVAEPWHDGVIVLREEGGVGPFRGARVENPVATCFVSFERTVEPLKRRGGIARVLLAIQLLAVVGALVARLT